MTFQGDINKVKAKTGESPNDFRKLAVKKGVLKSGTKTGEIARK